MKETRKLFNNSQKKNSEKGDFLCNINKKLDITDKMDYNKNQIAMGGNRDEFQKRCNS